MKRTAERLLIAGFLVLSAAFAAHAQKSPRSALQISAENLSARTPSNKVMPGDTVRYHLLFTNVSAGAARGIVLDNPIPTGLRYEVGSAKADRADVAILFSIDGGKSYSAEPMIDVVVDGRHEQHAAPSEMYTHVRWTVRGDVPKGAQVRADYDALVPAVSAARSSLTK